jgi:SRSO17 transposase
MRCSRVHPGRSADEWVRYLRGLMLDGRRKSMQPMGERLGVGSPAVAVHDVLDLELRRRPPPSGGEGPDVVDPVAWVIDDTGFVKDGTASPGVARQYSGTSRSSPRSPASTADQLPQRQRTRRVNPR